MAHKVSELNDIYPHNCPTLNAVRTLYGNWNAILDKKLGYIRYYKHVDGRQVMLYEHHLVVQAAYGEIPDGHHVHHVNQERSDNRAENLQVLSAEEHGRVHGNANIRRLLRIRGQRQPLGYATLNCDHCSKPFQRTVSHVRHTGNYCSQNCAHLAARKVARPTAEELGSMLSTTSYEALGRQFGVTGKAIKKWAKQYGLT